MDPSQPPADQLDWGPALSWLPALAAADFEPGHVSGGEPVEPGMLNWPHITLAPQARAFIACLHDTQVIADADWSSWLEHGGRALYDDPEVLARATLEQCRMLLIAHVRADRFTDGHLLSILHDGHLVAILTRIRELVDPKR